MKSIPRFPGSITEGPMGRFVPLSEYMELREYAYESRKYTEELIDFMRVVSRKLNCLPSFADPSPRSGNSHVINALDRIIGTNAS